MEPAPRILPEIPRRIRSPNSQNAQPTYGYHNTFHTHAQLPVGSPPTYARASDPQSLRHLEEKARRETEAARSDDRPPAYTCSVELGGIMGVRKELSSPFRVSGHREWYNAYVVLRGTLLSIHRVKHPNILSKNRRPSPGRLIVSYSLQHAEVGMASDVKKSALIPKSPLAHFVPAASRQKVFETDPHLFEPIREHVLRLRVEAEQFLLCADTEEEMLSWTEALCAAIDISPPIEDRSEPRYRSLPRRNRRQRALDGGQYAENLESLSSVEAGRRIIAEQERIIRQLYPNLAGTREPENPAPGADAETEDFDAEDVRFPTRSSTRDARPHSSQDDDDERPSTSPADPKSTPTNQPDPAQTLRYRRRCAPVLLATSPRVSDVVFSEGIRMRISVREQTMTEFTSHPPRYDAHGWPKAKRAPKHIAIQIPTTAATCETVPTHSDAQRPSSPVRGMSDDSITSISFGEDLAPTRSEHGSDDIAFAAPSGPPSPTGLAHKMDAERQLDGMGKRRNSEGGFGAALGVGLLV
ncbi:hypothetical protein P153DRAFT_364314 [Dothidotthia symphoricarpi CBS 119687]|uniref:PH domain-containing protein n=1 Tax=Dothidotthia symphoricarpi CBS 119687 TaxID=1392245 RepID=A0A6A6ALR3_9PLEO|nr:uncharacterized protein P153DRAFT_364314 [Dothidotthia symphoricarpi CBS 119687]KAF2131827.1 hypothetical protein P153DRAFT_364314 [Dothidotthia symphoricarpi CBS 119687]